MTTDYNARAAKGQALNLAVNDAIHAGKQNDKKYIFKQFVYYYNLGIVTQELTIEEIKKL
jgi:hypothetical protein